MRKDSSEKLTGNAQFEGYAVDLIHEISKILGFNYTFRLVPDGKYGSLSRETKEWDGMIKELLDQVSQPSPLIGCWYYNLFTRNMTIYAVCFQRADIAVADLTITYDREQAVDFTMPFMNLGKEVF